MNCCRFLLFLTVMFAIDARGAESSLVSSTIVIYNKAARDSAELARFYAKQRGIASDHIVGVTCSTDEEITREEYDSNIAEPLRETFKTKKWWTLREAPEQQTVVMSTSIRFVAVIKGMPLKIKPTAEPYPGDESAPGPVSGHNEASVDSELTILGLFSHQISGPLRNVYFQSFKAISELDNPVLLLVCRLDASNAETVRRMIVDSIAAEKKGLWGRAYVDGAHETAAGYALGDQWLGEIAVQLHKVGVPVIYDNIPALFPEGYPMTDCALYYGWRTEKAVGPFAQPDFRFSRGAVAVHIHSFSAMTLRDPNAFWVAPLLEHGAAATLGNVYEPYLQFTAHLNIFNDHLLHGFTFAESAYSSIAVVSWMSVMVGDPLYRPYASWLQLEAVTDSGKTDSWKMYHDFAIQNFSNASAQYRPLARQAALRARNCPMIEDLGLMEAADGNFASAANYLAQAHVCYSTRDDILRVILEEADAWNKLKKPKRGIELLRTALRVSGNAPAAPLLRSKEQELRGALTTPTPGPRATPRVRVRF
ncbi:MAG TPA: TIGR03790 family protein [Chthoniobacterales bacterium]|nr:TIGR03790 family protein [Chthoniobacterales bacterium]